MVLVDTDLARLLDRLSHFEVPTVGPLVDSRVA
jgi:hypothetical protein